MDSYTQKRYEKDIAYTLKSKFDNYDEIVEAVSDFISSAFDDGYDEGNENGYEEGYDEGASSKKHATELTEKQENYIFRELDNIVVDTDLTFKIMDIIKEGLQK
jgi:flagellar biosynthesis/type III secretory pathway protein FliH